MAETRFAARLGATLPDTIDAKWVGAAVAVLIAIRLAAAAAIDLGADESYYFLWSRYPSLGYYDHPPMVAWWIAAGTALLGDNPFGIRFLFVLSAIPTTLAVYLAGRILFDRPSALFAALWINATLLFGVGGISATPDAPAVMFWACATAVLVLAFVTGNGLWWLAVGAFAGLGVLSKLTVLFLGPGILLCLLVRADLRRWWLTPWPWLGGAAALAIVLPLLWWNAGNDWMTFSRQFGRLQPSSFNALRFSELIATQFALLNPVIALFVGLAAFAWVRRSAGYQTRAIGLLFWGTIPLLAYMTFHSFHGQVQAHWLAPVFPPLVLAGAAAAVAAPAERWAGWRALAFPVGAVVSVVGLLLAANPGGILPPAVDPGKMNHGWAGVAEEANRLREETGAEWIATANYAANAIVSYKLRGTAVPVIAVTERDRYRFAPTPDPALLAKAALLVVRPSSAAEMAACFDHIIPVGSIDRKSGGRSIETLAAFRVTGARPSLFQDGC
jgi:4-amino-4-deoxy-L-arabinose transferase-like glycosyltransferase